MGTIKWGDLDLFLVYFMIFSTSLQPPLNHLTPSRIYGTVFYSLD